MKKHVILGVNDNPKYLYYLPLVVWAWRYLGWEPLIFFHWPNNTERQLKIEELILSQSKANKNFFIIKNINGYKSETLVQVSRLYGTCVADDDSYLMTSDVDMLPLDKNTFHYEGHRVLSIGRDLTDYHYPICYIGARCYIWRRFMKMIGNDYESLMNRDMRHQQNMWGLDQDILTEKLLSYGLDNIHHVNRGTDTRTGYPIGRVDRSNWRLDHKELIDAHLPHDVLTNDKSFHNVLNLLHHVWPKEDWTWFVSYHKEFKKLL